MVTLLLTRPREKMELLASQLEAQGYRVVLAPLLHINMLPGNAGALAAMLARRPQAILASSGSGVEALAQLSGERSIPLLVVGAATAAKAQSLGFTVTGHSETAETLVQFAAKEYAPAGGLLLYARGTHISHDLCGDLARLGFTAEEVTLYSAEAAQGFSAEVAADIRAGDISGVLFFSRRTAETYATLASKYGLVPHHAAMTALCLSDAIAEKLRALPWKASHVADKPDMESVMKLVQAF